jgi:membrane associated rhomboid family serine protease
VIPLRDTIPSARVPVVNYAIIALNVVVFLYETSLGRHLEAFILTWGLVPRDFTLPTLVTSMFLHGSWMHLLGNMLYLYIFGDNVEDRLGHARYACFYLLCGMAAGATQALINPASGVPVVGASGAIAGVSGAYFLFFPGARVVTLVPIFFFLQVIEVPAVFFLLIWFVWQLISGVATIGGGKAGVEGGVAFWAHIGGFLAGMLFGLVLRIRASPPPRWV